MSLSIAALQHKYNLNQNLIDNWHKALRSLSASDFYTSEIDFDYPDAINYVLGPMEDQILVKIGLNSIPTVYLVFRLLQKIRLVCVIPHVR